MIHVNNSARLPGARAVDDPSSTAELLDDGFMGQFEPLNPNYLPFQQDIDYWLTLTQDEAFYQDDSSLYPQDLEGGVEFTADAQHDTSSEQGPYVAYQHQSKATQSPINDMGNNSQVQRNLRLEQDHDVFDQVPNHNLNNGMYAGIDFNENSQFLYSDQLYQDMVTPYKDYQHLSNDIDINLGFQSAGFEQPADMENWKRDFQELFNIDFNQQFQLNYSEQAVNTKDPHQENLDEVAALVTVNNDTVYHPEDILDEVAAIGTVHNGSVYHHQEPRGVLINPSLTWVGQVPLDLVALLGAENGSLYQSKEPHGGSLDLGLTPVPKIEQSPPILESVPQVPYPLPNLSHRIPPDSQHLNGVNIVPPTPEREKSNGTQYRRRANIKNMNPSQFYEKVLVVPDSWKPHQDSSVTFQYNEYGNLRTDHRFSVHDIMEYLFYHPLNCNEKNEYDAKKSGLTLWIQTVPADAAKRYPDKKSDKCRFADCPIPGGSIRKGFFRVALDENSKSERLVDPYHCAGFVHLFCLEKFCNFPEICQLFNVQPDQRQFAEGTNKMAITRDHREMAEVVRAFMRSAHNRGPWDYEESLSFQLTSKHLELQPKTRQNQRAERGGNHIELHKGDLDKFVAGESLKIELRNERKRNAPEGEKRKRHALEEDEGIANLKHEIKEQEERPTKRTRRDFW